MKFCIHSRWYASGLAAYPGLDAFGLRIFDAVGCHWNEINTAKNVFDFSKLDRLVAMAESRGHRILYNLGLTPAWASARPDEPAAGYPSTPGRYAEPRDMEDWRTWVRTVGQRYGNRIEAYSIWNEPNGGGFTGTPEQLMQMQQIAREELPSSLLLTPEYTHWSGVAALDAFLTAGGPFDIIAHHWYADTPDDMRNQINALLDTLKKHNCTQPLWITETSFGLTATPPWRTRREPDLIRSLNWHNDIFRAAGVERMYWLAPDSDSWGFMGFRQIESAWNTLAAIPPPSRQIGFTMQGQGYFNVLKDGNIISQRPTEREAAQEAVNATLLFPDSTISYVHDYRVDTIAKTGAIT